MQISIFYHVDPLQKEDAAQVEVAETLHEEKGEDKEDNMPVPTKKFRLKRGSAKAKANVEPEESEPETKPETKINKPEGIPNFKETAKPQKKLGLSHKTPSAGPGDTDAAAALLPLGKDADA